MHEHTHGCCDHCLHYCNICGKAYCCKCGREWGNVNYSYSYPITRGTTYDAGDTSDNITYAHVHGH